MNSKEWKKYIGKQVRLIVNDNTEYPRPRDGIFIDIDNTHVFLKIKEGELPKPFLRADVKRIDVK